MKFLKTTLLLSFFSLILSQHVFAQRDTMSLTTIVQKTQKYAYQYPVEKVYLQFDKPYYAVGDTIWFKAYVTAGLHTPTPLSKVVYVDMFDKRDSLVATLKLPVNNGIAWGDILLPKFTFKEGNYHIFAYTKWMRNFDGAYFFNKNIPVGSDVQGQLMSKISFANNITDAASNINATILYKDETGAPYANKKVTWQAVLDDETIAKGKGTTDQNGKVNITYKSDKLSNLSPGTIESTIELASKKNSVRVFPVVLADRTDDIQFFPEGGELITGVKSRLAFKAIRPDGLGVDAKGTIVDNTGATVVDFTSSHLGMGVLSFQPESGKTYKANVTFADGSKGTYVLPRIKSSGISISVYNSDPQNLEIKITTNQAFLDKNASKPVYIVGQSGQVICYAAQTTLSTLNYSATISKAKFPTGILQLTLFSDHGEPLSERVAFIQHNDLLTLNVASDRKIYPARGKVKMTLNAKNQATPIEGSFSVAVINESKVPANDDAETTILSSLLLTSDLRGYVEQPNYYFNHHDQAAADNLDNLMMTQGYRRFSYKNILADKLPQLYFLPEQGIELAGTLRQTNGIPVFKGNIRLIIPDKNFSTEALTDADGNFDFNKLSFRDSSEVTVTARNNTNAKNLMLTLKNDSYPGKTKNTSEPNEIFNIDSLLEVYVENAKHQYSNTQILHEVTVKATAIVKKPSHMDYPELAGLSVMADEELKGERLGSCTYLAQCISGTRLTLVDNQLILTKNYNAGNKTPVQIIYNGMQVDEVFLNTLKSSDVESVEIFKDDGVSGLNRMTNTSGVVVINGKQKPKIAEKDQQHITADQLQDLLASQQNTLKVKPRGFNFGKEFYVPKYEVGKASSVGIDLRTTVYWNPHITTDKATGNATFEFTNGDGQGTYKAIVEGFDTDGNLGRYIYQYKVQ